MTKVNIPDQNIVEVVCFSHPRLEWSIWIGVGNLIQQGTREIHQNLSREQQSDSDFLKEKCATVNMDKSGNCMPRCSKDYED